MQVEEILIERYQTHGDWRAQATAGAEIRNAIQRWDTKGLPASQIEALLMIAVKMSRILQGNPNHEDHWDDIAGYAKLGSKACNQK